MLPHTITSLPGLTIRQVFFIYFYNMRGIFVSWFSIFHITMKLSRQSLMLGLLACVLDIEH